MYSFPRDSSASLGMTGVGEECLARNDKREFALAAQYLNVRITQSRGRRKNRGELEKYELIDL